MKRRIPVIDPDAAVITQRIALSFHTGQCLTVKDLRTRTISLILWAKNGTPKLPLHLSIREARELMLQLRDAIGKAEEL